MTLRELADRVHIDFSALSRAENGRRNLNDNDIMILTNFFNVSSDYLLGLSDKRVPEPIATPSAAPIQDEALIALYNQTEGLSKEQMDQVISYVQFLKSKENK
ncbi:MAG: helix-turn-helix domain-containing protein [Roseburia sp.]|nr:helix-turn-helix domain-containing protein [Anaeroplasma bactoclasticum]MCM1195533.1 helix-turn-helix domain-containing protein [Roseburia sp.]